MLLSAVIIILREVLELALLTSILLALGKQMKISARWFFFTLIVGLVGAWIYGVNTARISEWFDYTGQEVVNGVSQIIIYLLLVMMVFITHLQSAIVKRITPWIMALSVSLLITREGSEIYIYLSGFVQSEQFSSVLVGSVIGASIGLSVGALFFYILSYKEDQLRYFVGMCMLSVIAAGLLAQSVPMFMQADIIEASPPIWDSSFLLNEQSLIGQLVYAVAGYEATPTLMQVLANIFGLCAILALVFVPIILNEKGFLNKKASDDV